ncbi:glycine cleavage system protein P (pyridoxal-binding), N-terminal domain [Candidatus Gastranaerophilus sp. (ex Termes propinquus)]|nr:glycine cleavage system protein P (pyridoxal-binding), N-terminal domain [Candidatus Gastranaerophilus sp. (ex Termes propinquus)]
MSLHTGEMLKRVGTESVEELFACIDKEARVSGLNLPEQINEMQAQKRLRALAGTNKVDYACFLGGGSYKRFIPSAISAVVSRFEFLSAYTPYQAEMSQGSLQAMYEFQTIICNLVNMDAANASVYDGASACAEAILMACRINKNASQKVWISKKINPNYLNVIKTYLWAADIEIVENKADKDLTCKLFQFPNYFGELEDAPVKVGKELIIASLDP